MALVTAAVARGPEMPASIVADRGGAEAAGRGLRLARRRRAPRCAPATTRSGAHVCEFPTTRAAAAEAKARGNPVLMGAPNVVRGRSQSGNVAAEALIGEGLCDVLVSDYYYPALAAAAWALADRGALRLRRRLAADLDRTRRRCWGCPTVAGCARALGRMWWSWTRRPRRIEATFVAGRPVHLCGRAAQRFLARSGTAGACRGMSAHG